MAFEVKIYGDISDKQAENNYTLKDLQTRLEQYNDEQDVIIGIKTNGGSVYEGFAIYNQLRRFAQENKIKLITRADGLVASIGTVIYLAGDKRIMAENIRPFIHEAYSKKGEDANYENELLATFYTKHTKMSLEQAKNIMKNDTFLSMDDALNYRFATEKENISTPEFLNKIKNMNTTTKKPFFTRVWELFSSPNNKMEHNASNVEVEFPDVETGGAIQIGDKANIDGKPANGDVTMQDGSVYRFENGVLKEVIKKQEDPQEPEKPEKEEKKIMAFLEQKFNALDSKIASLTETNTQLKEENEKLKMDNHKKEDVINSYKGVVSKPPVTEKENRYPSTPDPLADLEDYNLNF